MKTNEESVVEKTKDEKILEKAKNGDEIIQKNLKIEKNDNKKKHNKTCKVLLVMLVLIILTLILLSIAFALLNYNNINIIGGVKVQGIDISNCTKENAYKLLNRKIFDNRIEVVRLKYEGNSYDINLEEIELQYNIEKALEEAYNWGRNKNIILNNYEILYATFCKKEFELDITCNSDKLKNEIKKIESTIEGSIVEPNYYIENNVLIITKGTKGLKINQDDIKEKIIKNVKENINEVIKIKVAMSEPSIINIDKIHQDVFKSPKDASYIKEPFEIFPEVKGIDFDVNKAKELIKTEKNEYKIDLIITLPKITIIDLDVDFTPDLLGAFSTKFDEGNTNRSTNLRLAAAKINGTIIMPGEIFSYNKVVGERTAAKGYKSAGMFSGGKVVSGIGGGICQISSTLYNAVLYANLETVSRKNHAFLTGYVEPGRDATVSYGTIDFQFKNTRKYPIKIVASAKNGVSKIEIYGIKEDIEYEVDIVTDVLGYKGFTTKYEETDTLQPGATKVLQNGIKGCSCVTYKILKLNGKEISKEKITADTYKACTKIIARGIEIVQEIPVETLNGNSNPEIEDNVA